MKGCEIALYLLKPPSGIEALCKFETIGGQVCMLAWPSQAAEYVSSSRSEITSEVNEGLLTCR